MTKRDPNNMQRIIKAAKLLDLLQTGTGARLEEMVEATGWQPPTVGTALTGFRKKGHVIAKNVEGHTTIWSVTPAA